MSVSDHHSFCFSTPLTNNDNLCYDASYEQTEGGFFNWFGRTKLNGRIHMSDLKTAEKLATKAAKEEAKVLAIEQKFALENAEFAKFLKQQEERQRQVNKLWDDVKAALVEAGYFDVIENENFRVSVSRVFGIKVTDVDALPDEFKKTVEVPITEKIKKHFELYGELPDGTADGSYYRLNKKVK